MEFSSLEKRGKKYLSPRFIPVTKFQQVLNTTVPCFQRLSRNAIVNYVKNMKHQRNIVTHRAEAKTNKQTNKKLKQKTYVEHLHTVAQ